VCFDSCPREYGQRIRFDTTIYPLIKMGEAVVHVVLENDISQQILVTLPYHPPLLSSFVRVRASLMDITVNNHPYARLSSALQLWYTYPVP
jgi:hypothetical protein